MQVKSTSVTEKLIRNKTMSNQISINEYSTGIQLIYEHITKLSIYTVQVLDVEYSDVDSAECRPATMCFYESDTNP